MSALQESNRQYRNLDYDALVKAKDYRAPEVLFGLAFDFVKPGESVLDIGIGTGLGGRRFHKAGLKVYGMDRSDDMLDACRRKGFAEALARHDLTQPPYPYADGSIDHALCVGVLPHIENLTPVFREVARILRRGGIFAFMVGEQTQKLNCSNEALAGQYAQVAMFSHPQETVRDHLARYGFRRLRSVAFTVAHGKTETHPMPVRGYVVSVPSACGYQP